MAHEMLWQQIHVAREELLSDLEKLNDAQWHERTLCSEWDVQQLVAHMIGTATSTKLGFFKGLAKNKGNFAEHINTAVRENSAGTPAETLERYRETMHSRTAPPGPVQSWLGEAIIHAEDIRHPLGIEHAYAPEALREVADFYKGSNLIIGAKKRISGLKLMATDQNWETGDGPIVSGPMIALIMSMTGRSAYLDQLEGDGVATFRSRFEK